MKNKKIIAVFFFICFLLSVGTPVILKGARPQLQVASAQMTCSDGSAANTDFSSLPQNVRTGAQERNAKIFCQSTIGGLSSLNIRGAPVYTFYDGNGNPADKWVGNASGTFQRTSTKGLGGLISRAVGLEKNTADCSAGITNLSGFFSVKCWSRVLGAGIAAVFSWIGSMLLWIAGGLFNYLVEATIILFREFLYGGQGGIGAVIDLAWTFFRDIANILIIGVFTFIALSIIMGLKTYGQKKLIANVLIVAILINFSLLFTKITIDVSNFLASEFYKAAVVQSAPPGASNEEKKKFAADKGISGAMMQAIGIMGFSDAYNQVREIQERQDNGLAGIGFGLMSFIYLVGAAIVLFYGAILLIARAIALVVLMITSAAAFATYLIPTLEHTGYNWKTWSEALIRNAVFAPILMLFLWITLAVAAAMKPIIDGATLGSAQNIPTDNAKALFAYFFILGLLYLSFKLSSKFSGFTGNAVTSLALAGTAAPLALGAATTGFGLRQAAGRKGATLAKKWGEDLDSERAKLTNPDLKAGDTAGIQAKIKRLQIMKGLAESASKKSFNPMNTAIGKHLAKQAGVPDVLAGASGEGGFEGAAKKKAEAAVARAESLYNISGHGKDHIADKRALEEWRKDRAEELRSAETRADEQLRHDEKRLREETDRADSLREQIQGLESTIRSQGGAPQPGAAATIAPAASSDAQRPVAAPTVTTITPAAAPTAPATPATPATPQAPAAETGSAIRTNDKQIEDLRKQLASAERAIETLAPQVERQTGVLQGATAAYNAHKADPNVAPSTTADQKEFDKLKKKHLTLINQNLNEIKIEAAGQEAIPRALKVLGVKTTYVQAKAEGILKDKHWNESQKSSFRKALDEAKAEEKASATGGDAH